MTRELFEERFKSLEKEINEQLKVVDERSNGLNFKLNIFIAIALTALIYANLTFVMLIEKIFIWDKVIILFLMKSLQIQSLTTLIGNVLVYSKNLYHLRGEKCFTNPYGN